MMRFSCRTFAVLTAISAFSAPASAGAQTNTPTGNRPAEPARKYSHADSLRGSNGPGRAWWDATYYDLNVAITPTDSSIRGWNAITYMVLSASKPMQMDLQPPLVVDSIRQDGRDVKYTRDGNALMLALTAAQKVGDSKTVTVYYHGKPVAAKRPPWDGGYIWRTDSVGNPWVATANEGLGASVWWPNKDYFGDEPDSQRVAITVPDSMINVSNGRMRGRKRNGNGTTTYEWFVNEPINNYNIAVNAGSYERFFDVYQGEGGTLSLDYYALRYHVADARKQWAQVKPMLKCFENWFGPYPWYRDGYKLIEAPHLGMEHQSAVAYGNGFQNGYLGRDLSKTGRGLTWDFIIVHESAHEWWGNSLTGKDAAYMWIHESFANYAENLYVECQTGDKKAGAEYVIGTRELVRNDRPIEGVPSVNDEGSGNDHYYKGGNMLHLIRQLVGNDDKWKQILRGLQSTFRHQTISGAQVEQYITKESGINLSKVFDQYLRTTKLPALEYKIDGGQLAYRWANVVAGFDMPVQVTIPGRGAVMLKPTTEWNREAGVATLEGFAVDVNWYVTAKPMS
ncbi:MAG: M1 family metallopeptidase [Gemmatimonadetes bacterium]|nr:M1 family metallopeptidase [Gemmatimonadota bacterium]